MAEDILNKIVEDKQQEIAFGKTKFAGTHAS